MGAFVKFENVKKVYQMGEVQIEALRDATFQIEKGEICVIVGPSGAGKTTLLNILGGMDTLTSGKVWLDGEEISKYNQKQLTTYRRYAIGFVFQFYNLVQNLTALENVSLATQICKEPMDSAEALRKVGLGDRLNNFHPSFPAENSSVLPLPELLQKIQSSFCAMNPRERWTIIQEKLSSSCFRTLPNRRV